MPDSFNPNKKLKPWMMKKKTTWDDVRQKCGLDADTIKMAQQLGMKPHTVMANHASTKQERWKSPTAEWIRDMYEKRFKGE
jgi:hypothetical protein